MKRLLFICLALLCFAVVIPGVSASPDVGAAMVYESNESVDVATEVNAEVSDFVLDAVVYYNAWVHYLDREGPVLIPTVPIMHSSEYVSCIKTVPITSLLGS